MRLGIFARNMCGRDDNAAPTLLAHGNCNFVFGWQERRDRGIDGWCHQSEALGQSIASYVSKSLKTKGDLEKPSFTEVKLGPSAQKTLA
jgi:hypothetical protein